MEEVSKTFIRGLVDWFIEEFSSFEECLYIKASQGKTKTLSLDNLRSKKDMNIHFVKWTQTFIKNLKEAYMGKTDTITELMQCRLKTMQLLSTGCGYEMPCIINMVEIFMFEVRNEVRRNHLNITSLETYMISLNKELEFISRDEMLINDLAEISIHECSLKKPEDCIRHFSIGTMRSRREKRHLTKALKKFKIRNSILKQHCKLPLTALINYDRHIYHDHAKLLEESMTGQHHVLETRRIIVLMINPMKLIEHTLYICIWTTYAENRTYRFLLDHIIKNMNKYYSKYTYGDKQLKLHDIKLSRYNLDLIEEKKPVFEDGEILWINHIKCEKDLSWIVPINNSSCRNEIVDESLCWWCFKNVGRPCGRCGISNSCSPTCHVMMWPKHYEFCRTQERLPRTEEQVLGQGKKIFKDLFKYASERILYFECKLFKKETLNVTDDIVRYYTDVANSYYDRILDMGKLVLSIQDEGFIVDPDQHYDPVCLLTRIIRLFIRTHLQVQREKLNLTGDGLFDKNIAELQRIWTAEFIDQEVRLLIHDCINNSTVVSSSINSGGEIPNVPTKRFTTAMFHPSDIEGRFKLRVTLPFTDPTNIHNLSTYDSTYSKCDKIASYVEVDLSGATIDLPKTPTKIIEVIVLNSESGVRCSHSLYLAVRKLYNVREIERLILSILLKDKCSDMWINQKFEDLKLSRRNLKLITEEMAEFEDGEILLVNHIFYYAQFLNTSLWRVLIHDATAVMADPKLCHWCYSKIGKPCSLCKKALYCSVECQKIHWPMHRFYCVGGDELISKIVLP